MRRRYRSRSRVASGPGAANVAYSARTQGDTRGLRAVRMARETQAYRQMRASFSGLRNAASASASRSGDT